DQAGAVGGPAQVRVMSIDKNAILCRADVHFGDGGANLDGPAIAGQRVLRPFETRAAMADDLAHLAGRVAQAICRRIGAGGLVIRVEGDKRTTDITALFLSAGREREKRQEDQGPEKAERGRSHDKSLHCGPRVVVRWKQWLL